MSLRTFEKPHATSGLRFRDKFPEDSANGVSRVTGPDPGAPARHKCSGVPSGHHSPKTLTSENCGALGELTSHYGGMGTHSRTEWLLGSQGESEEQPFVFRALDISNVRRRGASKQLSVEARPFIGSSGSWHCRCKTQGCHGNRIRKDETSSSLSAIVSGSYI